MKTENGYKLLSVDHEMLGQLITVENTHSNGFNDLVIAFHDSASEKTLNVYHYQNGLYHESACYDANWESSDEGSLHYLKHPTITECSQ